MSIPGIILALLGAVLGAAIGDEAGFLFGLITGYTLGWVIQLNRRIGVLENALARSTSTSEQAPAAVEQAPSADESQPVSDLGLPPLDLVFHAEPESSIPSGKTGTETAQQPIQTPVDIQTGTPQETTVDKLLAKIYGFFSDGNVVVKVGVLILFVGVGFLLKYAAAHSMLPVQLRIAGIAAGGVALLLFGWRLRIRKRLYALLLQGGGVGVLYLTVFAAGKLYHLLPPGFTLVIMVALVVLSGILAVLQDARYLAFYGAAGGFLAPVLASTGGGSHVMLFSYYALLNVGILGIAWYRSWRELNLLGFVFTFVIGMVWGAKFYQPVYFASVEPFLILFFLFFVIIAILFAFRQPPQLKGYIDSSLVFGVPIIAFGLQAALVKGMAFGLAYSAVAMSAFYILLATLLWKRQVAGMRVLTEAFLAMGVVFGSLAIPLALDGRWTSVAWSLEGAAIVWVGVRQARLLPRLFGLLLQIGAGVFFVQALHFHGGNLPIINGVFMGAMFISITGLFSSYYLDKHKGQLRVWECGFILPLLIWGVVWWLGAGYNELQDFIVSERKVWQFLLIFITASLLVARYLQFRLAWSNLRYVILGQLYAMLLIAGILILIGSTHPFGIYGWLSWPFAFYGFYLIMYSYRDQLSPGILRWQHVIGFWLLILLLTVEAAWLVHHWVGGHTWHSVMYILLPALCMWLLIAQARRLHWPFRQHYTWYAVDAGRVVILLTGLLALLMGVLHNGNPWPLYYIPLLNPLDISVAFVLLVIILWLRDVTRHLSAFTTLLTSGQVYSILAAGAFLWINGMIARTAHYWFDVPHNLRALSHSVIFQASISVVWTLTAMLLMWLASRRGQRQIWFIGLALFLATVAKLFLIDIADKNELTMIISLIIVAVVAIGFGYYLSPLPPKRQEKTP